MNENEKKVVMARLKAVQDQAFMALDDDMELIGSMADNMLMESRKATEDGDNELATKLAIAASCMTLIRAEIAYRQAEREG